MARRPKVAEVARDTRDRLRAMQAVAGRLQGWRPRAEVIRDVEAVPTIFPQYDDVVGVGGHPISRFTLVHGPSNEGKAIADGTPVLTPWGWVPVDDLVPGDEVVGSNGEPTKVIGVYPQGEKDLYKVTFSDGASVECCDEHLWFTTTVKELNTGRYSRGKRPARKRTATGKVGGGSVKRLVDIRASINAGHEIPVLSGAVRYEPLGGLVLDPYLLGLLLGDGCMSGSSPTPRFCKPDRDLHVALEALLPAGDSLSRYDALTSGIRGGNVRSALEKLGLWGCRSWEKFVPAPYLRASPADRLALLRGLIDTDGSVDKDGAAVEYSSTSFSLIDAVVEIARSLGAIVHQAMRMPSYTYRGELRHGRQSGRVKIVFNDGTLPFSSDKHRRRWVGRAKRQQRRIESVVFSRRAHATCIAVDAADHLYAIDGFVVTHNTEFALGLGLSFLQAGHFFGLADAERTTTDRWVRTLMAGAADHPGFSALPVTTYEQVRASVREYCETIARARDKGELPVDTTGLIVVDSIRKLVPKKLWEELSKMGGGDEPPDPAAKKRGGFRARKREVHVDGYGGRAAQLKAAMNAAWVDELIPLLADTRMAMLVIARENVAVDANPFAGKNADVKVGGGIALKYEASLEARITRSWVRDADGAVIGEQKRLDVIKTKVADKQQAVPSCNFYTSNGVLKGTPVGFDRARDLIELGLDLDVLSLKGSWISVAGQQIGQGLDRSVQALYGDPGLFTSVEAAVRAAIARRHAGGKEG